MIFSYSDFLFSFYSPLPLSFLVSLICFLSFHSLLLSLSPLCLSLLSSISVPTFSFPSLCLSLSLARDRRNCADADRPSRGQSTLSRCAGAYYLHTQTITAVLLLHTVTIIVPYKIITAAYHLHTKPVTIIY